MIGFFLIRTEDGKRAYVRADEVGTIYESRVSIKPGAGRPAKGQEPGLKMVDCVTLRLRNGGQLHARGETIESIRAVLNQALATQVHFFDRAGPHEAEAA